MEKQQITSLEYNFLSNIQVQKIKLRESGDNTLNTNFFFFMNYPIFKNLINIIGACPECNAKHFYGENLSNDRMGFAPKIQVFFENCSWKHSLFRSDHCNKQVRGRNIFEINVRTTVSFRKIGKCATAITNFARVTNMDGLAINSVTNINETYAYDKVAEQSMVNAALEANESAELHDNKAMCRVLVDGSWQKR